MSTRNPTKCTACLRRIVFRGAPAPAGVRAAGTDPSKGAAFNADADRRSLSAQDALFAEVLAPR